MAKPLKNTHEARNDCMRRRFRTGWDPRIRLATLWKLLRTEKKGLRRRAGRRGGWQCQPDSTNGQTVKTFFFLNKTLERWMRRSSICYANKQLVSQKENRKGFYNKPKPPYEYLCPCTKVNRSNEHRRSIHSTVLVGTFYNFVKCA